MSNLKLDIAFWDYDRTRALANGTLKIPNVDTTFHSAPIVTQIFDVSELGLTYFLRTFEGLDSPFVAIPIFPNRSFRHSAV